MITRPDEPNKDHSLLKLVAVLTMMVDHAGVVFFPGVLWLRVIGRIAFPLFAWGIAVGAQKTRDWRLYALRLLLIGIVSQPFYMLALTHSWAELNIFATLLLGLLAVVGIQKRWVFSHIWAPALCLLLGAAIRMDYGWRGVLLIILMYLVRDTRAGLAALMVAFCLYWGGGGSVLPREWTTALTSTPWVPLNRALGEFFSLFRLQSLAILALPFMMARTHSTMKIPKWLGYAAYPGHLALYWLIDRFL
ncbi:MAG TPA: TraX family protein [Candidatus Limnocylindria bacterium]|nr:TraX family protein [Candidatus Limnocylindria bacterium]